MTIFEIMYIDFIGLEMVKIKFFKNFSKIGRTNLLRIFCQHSGAQFCQKEFRILKFTWIYFELVGLEKVKKLSKIERVKPIFWGFGFQELPSTPLYPHLLKTSRRVWIFFQIYFHLIDLQICQKCCQKCKIGNRLF